MRSKMANHKEDGISGVYISKIVEAINALREAVITLYIYQKADICMEIAEGKNQAEDLNGLLIQIDEIIKRLNFYEL
jgi:hypothetical protein